MNSCDRPLDFGSLDPPRWKCTPPQFVAVLSSVRLHRIGKLGFVDYSGIRQVRTEIPRRLALRTRHAEAGTLDVRSPSQAECPRHGGGRRCLRYGHGQGETCSQLDARERPRMAVPLGAGAAQALAPLFDLWLRIRLERLPRVTWSEEI
jgi:hypothetical protein